MPIPDNWLRLWTLGWGLDPGGWVLCLSWKVGIYREFAFKLLQTVVSESVNGHCRFGSAHLFPGGPFLWRGGWISHGVTHQDGHVQEVSDGNWAQWFKASQCFDSSWWFMFTGFRCLTTRPCVRTIIITPTLPDLCQTSVLCTRPSWLLFRL